jgi:threonine dehydratase
MIEGNATIALEILDQLPDVDAVIAGVGGGGLLVCHSFHFIDMYYYY